MKKIMLNDKYGLTRAVLEGRKTQTRRIIPDSFFRRQWDVSGDTLVLEDADGTFVDIRKTKYAYQIGEIVAVAQRYRDCGGLMDDGTPRWDFIFSRDKGKGWDNKMFVRADLMPHQIRITNVRVERLQDISDNDCLSEGIIKCEECGVCYFVKQEDYCLGYNTTREAYAALIDKISGKGTWNKNPYVFVYDFELVK